MVALNISLGLFYLRIMVSKAQRITIYIIITLSTLVGIAFFIFILLQCGAPLKADLYWERRVLQQCVPNSVLLAVSYTNSAVVTSTDLALTILPIPMLLKSQISRNEKIVVLSIFVVASA